MRELTCLRITARIMFSSFIFMIMLTLTPYNHVNAETKIINATGKYTMGEGETMSVAKERALQDALRSASESVAVYVESYSKTKGLVLVEDEVKTLSAAVIKICSKKYDTPLILENNGGYSTLFTVHISVEIDSDKVESMNKRFKENVYLKEKYKSLQKKLEDTQNELIKLKTNINTNKVMTKETEKMIERNDEEYKQTIDDLEIAKRKLSLQYTIEPYEYAMKRIQNLQGNWYDSNGNLILTINNGYINGCQVICFLSAGDASGFRVKEKNGYRDMGLVIDHNNSKDFLYLDESIVLRRTKYPDYYESINGLYLGMSKKYLYEKYGKPDEIIKNGPAFPTECWIYNNSFNVFFTGDMASSIKVYSNTFKCDKSGVTVDSSISDLSKYYKLFYSSIERDYRGKEPRSATFDLSKGEFLEIYHGEEKWYIELSSFY